MRQRRMGKGPGGMRDMDVDSEEEEEDTVALVDVRSRVIELCFTEAALMKTIVVVRALFLLCEGVGRWGFFVVCGYGRVDAGRE